MLSVRPSGVPTPITISLVRVSESAQGPLIGRLRSYLDPGRVFREKKAGESALAYSFSTGSTDPLSKGHTFRHNAKRRITYSLETAFPKVGLAPIFSWACSREGTESQNSQQSRSLTPNREEVQQERRCGWRLMTPASRSTREPRPWILVATEPTDEALRQGRNPQHEKG